MDISEICQVCLKPAVGDRLIQYRRPAGWWWVLIGALLGRKYWRVSAPFHGSCLAAVELQPPATPYLRWSRA